MPVNYRISHHRSITLTPISEFATKPPTIEAHYLGRGSWCTAYRGVRDPNYVYLLVSDNDHSKEIACDLPRNQHLPTCEKLGYVGLGRNLYRMPYYDKLTATRYPKAWAQFKLVKAAWEEAHDEQYDRTDRFHSYGHATIIATADRLKGSLSVAVREIADACANYGSSWTIEMAKRNCGVGKRGQLVMYDAWFDIVQVVKRYRRE